MIPARRHSRRMASSAAASSSRSPEVATITGSMTRTGGWTSSSHSDTVSMIWVVASIPVLTASTSTSSPTAASWAERMSIGGTWMARTPVVFWATTQVTTLIA